jgi:hypothetical protein
MPLCVRSDLPMSGCTRCLGGRVLDEVTAVATSWIVGPSIRSGVFQPMRGPERRRKDLRRPVGRRGDAQMIRGGYATQQSCRRP